MRLRAISADRGTANGHFAGVVHSVFRDACNLRLEDGRVVTLLAAQMGDVPHGVRLDTPPAFAFSAHLAPGRNCGCRAGVLRCGGSDLSVDLRGAALWQSQLPELDVDLTRPDVALAWRIACRQLCRHRDRRSCGDLDVLERAVIEHGPGLARAARRCRLAEAAIAVDKLIGCGPGLTPSGDDVIVGFLAGLRSSADRGSRRRAFLSSLAEIVADAARVTGDVSRTYLEHAIEGRFAETIAVLSRCIGYGCAAAEVERVTTKALDVGHTSGGDGVLGLLLGLVAWSAAPAAWLDLGAQLQAPGDGSNQRHRHHG